MYPKYTHDYYYYVIFYIIGQNYNFTSSHFTYDIYNNLFIYQAPPWKMRKCMWKCFTLWHKNKAVTSIPNQHLKSITNKLRWNAKEFPRLFICGLFNFIFHKHQSLGQISGQSWWNPPTHSIHSSLRVDSLQTTNYIDFPDIKQIKVRLCQRLFWPAGSCSPPLLCS